MRLVKRPGILLVILSMLSFPIWLTGCNNSDNQDTGPTVTSPEGGGSDVDLGSATSEPGPEAGSTTGGGTDIPGDDSGTTEEPTFEGDAPAEGTSE